MKRIQVIDSHTEGEPTRVVVGGQPDLGSGTALQRLELFRENFDWYRAAVVEEPRGWEALVGALLLDPVNPQAVAQVIFFNNVGPLWMCVHGTLGVGATLVHLGRIGPGEHLLETPAGEVTLRLDQDGSLAVRNVLSYRLAQDVSVRTQANGLVTGDIAWGGNWFFLISEHGQQIGLSNLEALTDYAWDVRQSLARTGITGAEGEEIDHVELFGAPRRADADSLNFVLCPGKAYDRSPCGTGTSAKLACLAADGKLNVGQVWRQESVIGSCFDGMIEQCAEGVIPTISGRAYVTAESTLLVDSEDPYRHGIGR